MKLDWSLYPNFSEDELKCKHSSKCEMHPDFMEKLHLLRKIYGQPIKISSGFRDASHPIEAAKAKPGAHNSGRAVDISCNGQEAFKLIALASQLGFTGIGVKQKGASRFIHLDDLPADNRYPRPTIWSY